MKTATYGNQWLVAVWMQVASLQIETHRAQYLLRLLQKYIEQFLVFVRSDRHRKLGWLGRLIFHRSGRRRLNRNELYRLDSLLNCNRWSKSGDLRELEWDNDCPAWNLWLLYRSSYLN